MKTIGALVVAVAVLALLAAGVLATASAEPEALSLTDIIVTGSDADGRTNPRIIRLDKNGNILWDKPLPLQKYNRDHRLADRNLTEDAFYTSTWFDENKIDGNNRIMKFDANGDLVWDKPLSPHPIAISANPVDGGIYAGAGGDIYKIDGDGNIVWKKYFAANWGRWIATDVTTGGLYAINLDYELLKIDRDGNLLWAKYFANDPGGLVANPTDGGVSLQHGIPIPGTACSENYLHRLDRDGNIMWTKHEFPSICLYGRAFSPIDGSLFIGSGWGHYLARITMDGDVVFKVATLDFNANLAADIEDTNVYVGRYAEYGVAKYDGTGNLIWSKTVGPSSWIGRYGITPVYTGMPSANTPPGSDVTVPLNGGLGQVGGVELTFPEVTGGGDTTLVKSTTGPPPDTGFKIEGIAGQPMYYDINTTATSWDLVTVCIRYDDSELTPEQENDLTLKRRNPVPPGPAWSELQNITRDTTNNIICGDSDTLSIFTIQLPVSVGGIVELQVDGSGSAIHSAADSSGGSPVHHYIALAGAVVAGALALSAGAWYARRRWLG